MAKYAVTYGRTDFFAEDLHTIFLSTPEDVVALAKEFVKVIPDDPEPYLAEAIKWNGQTSFFITHQDDDTFLFSCTPVALTTDLTEFHNYVKEFNAEP